MQRQFSLPEKIIVIALICAVLMMNCVSSAEDEPEVIFDGASARLKNTTETQRIAQELEDILRSSRVSLATVPARCEVGGVARELEEFERNL